MIKNCFVISVVIAGLLLVSTTELQAGQSALPDLTIPDGLGVNIHFRGAPPDIDMIAKAGLKFIRRDMTWASVEIEKGKYKFAEYGYDSLTKACNEHNIRIIYILDYSNKHYESERSVRTEAGRRAFAAFATKAAERYSGYGILWEIWNEPNTKTFWKPQPNVDDYCKLVEATVPGLRQADSTGIIVAPAMASVSFKWFEECFQKGLLNWIDALTVHPYRSRTPETVIEDYTQLRQLIKKYAPEGKEIPIISGEWGYSLVHYHISRLSEEQQAQYMMRMYLINLYQNIPINIWYNWKNKGVGRNNREYNFGIVMRDLKPKKAYFAAQTLSKVLEDYTFVERIDLGNKEDFVLKFIKNQNEAWAVWTTGGMHKVSIPTNAAEGIITDMLGNQTILSWPDNSLTIAITQSPQYILITSYK